MDLVNEWCSPICIRAISTRSSYDSRCQKMARFDSVLLVPTILSERVLLHPRDFTSEYKDVVLNTLREKVEGVCSRHGYVMRGSVELREVVAGRIEPNSMNGDTVFSVRYQAHVCNPPVGLIVKAIVTDSNAFAVFARSGILDEFGEFTPLLDVILTRAQHESDDRLSNLENGNDIYVEILGKRFELVDTRISVVALLRDENAYNTQNLAALNVNEEPLAFVRDVDGMIPIAKGLKLDDVVTVSRQHNNGNNDEDSDDNDPYDSDDDDDDEEDVNDDNDDNELLSKSGDESEFDESIVDDDEEEEEDDEDDDDGDEGVGDDVDDGSGIAKKRVQ